MWNAIRWIILRNTRIQDTQLPNQPAAIVRKQRIPDVVLVRELLQNANGIRTNGENTNSLLFEVFQILLQLDQLRLAESSPRGAPMKQNQRPPLSILRRV
jgi:hypothetical protein